MLPTAAKTSWRLIVGRFFYIDEFHSFTTEALADMLSELRKYGLGMVLAHQHTSQLDRTVFEAIFGTDEHVDGVSCWRF